MAAQQKDTEKCLIHMTNCSIFRKQTPNLRRIKIKSALTHHKDTAKYHKIFLKAISWGEKRENIL